MMKGFRSAPVRCCLFSSTSSTYAVYVDPERQSAIWIRAQVKGRGRCCKRFAHRASPLSLYASTACEDGFPSSQWIDLEDSILFWVHFQHTPTHRGSLVELAKSLASYVSGSRSRYVARGGTLCKEKSCREYRCGPLSCWDYPHTIAPCGAWELDSSGRTSTAALATTC